MELYQLSVLGVMLFIIVMDVVGWWDAQAAILGAVICMLILFKWQMLSIN